MTDGARYRETEPGTSDTGGGSAQPVTRQPGPAAVPPYAVARRNGPAIRNGPSRPLSRRDFLQTAGLAGAGVAFAFPDAPRGLSRRTPSPQSVQQSDFAIRFEDGAIASLKYAADTIDTEYVAPGARLGDVVLRYRSGDGGSWQGLATGAASSQRRIRSSPGAREHGMTVRGAIPGAPEVDVAFVVQDAALRWRVTVANASDRLVEIGDLALPLPINLNREQVGKDWVSTPVLRHGLVAGHGSFFFWMRSNSVGPYLTLTVDPGTKLEYWESRGGYRVFVHSAAAGAVAAGRGCDWRQPNTSLRLRPGEERSYGFTLRWADDYDDVRRVLVEQGLIDVHVVPGMTVPSDLSARLALRCNEPIHAIEAEHPEATSVRALGQRGDAEIWEVRFSRLGENLLTVRFGDGRTMPLEFFSTEPLETLIRKRAAFIAAHQVRDRSVWYDGLLAEWAMDTHVMPTPDDYDRIEGWRRYAVTCDDPGLSKPAFLAAKNAELPAQREVDALDYYIENFVWGGLQRTTEETFAYGIYSIPDWKTNRENDDPGRGGKQRLWRIYDYPHITLMYLSLYRVARRHPHIRTVLGAEDYLRRAYGTALAMFTIPWEIERWSPYETGLMNEPVIGEVIDALYAEGMLDEAERLRPHWERKARTFVVERPDIFRCEYAFCATGLEAAHALAKYALRVAEPRPLPEGEVRVGWVDYPPPTGIPLDDAREFMETQMAVNIFFRGSLEPAFYLLGCGSGSSLGYMSQLGGWSVLDYALHHAADPASHVRLGYASFLSSWALMNTGTPETDYGYWYPGPENDGAAGGQFEAEPYGVTWLGQPHSRGAWYYSCEIDLGFCGALRCARTVISDDPVFGRFCFGGDWRQEDGTVSVVPKDGVRRRFHAVLGTGRLHLESEAARFAAGQTIVVRDDLSQIRFRLETDNPEAQTARIRFECDRAGTWELRQEGQPTRRFALAGGWPSTIEVRVDGRQGSGTVTVARVGE